MNLQKLLVPCLASTICLQLVAPLASPAAAGKGDAEYEAGVKAYNTRDFKAASDHFSTALKEGKQSATLWLYCGHCFAAMGQRERAYQTYGIVVKSFATAAEATAAAQAMEKLRPGSIASATPVAAAAGATPAAAGAAPAAASKGAATAPEAKGLASRIIVVAPLFNHPAVSAASIAACRDAVAALPAPLRKLLDDNGTSIWLAPNLIDRWPESIKDLPENDPPETLAELPGRIYGKECMVYERPKTRFSNDLKAARPPRFIKQQALNMCFQQLDDLQNISKDPALRAEWEADKDRIPESVATKLATFMKEDDWGPRETCSELFGSMLGAGDDNTDNLYRYFQRTKKWLAAKLHI